MPTLREQYKETVDRLTEIAETAKSEDRDFTEEEVKEVTELDAKATELDGKIKAADAAQAAAAKHAGKTPAKRPAGQLEVKDRQEDSDAATFGERFTKSSLYGEFRKQHPTGLGQGSAVDIGRVRVGSMKEWLASRKATAAPLQVALGNVQPVRMPMVDQVDRDNLTILDLISRGQASGPFEYLQVTGVTRNAAVVQDEILPGDPASALKPTSTIQTELADAKPYTYADGYDVTNALLSDAPALASYMNNELEYSLDSVIEDKLLNGTGTAGDPRGILHTTGVQELTYTPTADAMGQVRAIRKAITRITTLPGGNVTACLMSPEDDEAWDLLQDASDRFFGQGPFGQGPNTSWGRARALSQRLAPGTVILGDWRQVALLDVEGLSILAFNQHKDYAQRNLVYVRAELRAEQVIWKPNRLIVVKPAA
ncbi:phage major capsid protein [Streptomyces sp. M2CJ-2]|uniref:phage major capsid protein n=1 Tax=Streptomyces sp. M2CJ-2 TaxID=2803948 RepID=UPI0019286F69|nr:phage major capsid protein [Streptomyces sp. M2CJ-2]MBL3670804.1 phage major capsid protein [Streptomyces sp. M2CJ-2]